MKDKKSNKFTTIGTYDNAPMAHIVKTRLEQDGIQCTIVDEHTVSIMSSLDAIALGRVKLKVETENAEKAKEIIETIKLVNRCFNCNEEIETKKYEKCEKCGFQEEKPDYSYSLKFMISMTLFALLPYIGILSGLIGLTGVSYKETRKEGIFLFVLSISSSVLFFFGIWSFKVFYNLFSS